MADRPFGFPDNPGRQQKRNNDRLVASVATQFGLGRYEDVERITPVLIADGDAPPMLQYKGWVSVLAALNAGFRSECALTNIAGDGSVVKVWIQLVAGATGKVIRLQPTLAGYTQVNTPYADARLGNGTSGSVFAMKKNTAAANATGTVLEPWAGTATPFVVEVGPFWLGAVGAARNILVQANADAEAVNVAFRWELYTAVK